MDHKICARCIDGVLNIYEVRETLEHWVVVDRIRFNKEATFVEVHSKCEVASTPLKIKGKGENISKNINIFICEIMCNKETGKEGQADSHVGCFHCANWLSLLRFFREICCEFSLFLYSD